MSRRTITFEEFQKECADAPKPLRFICPACGTKQGRKEFEAAHVTNEEMNKMAGFSCIGLFTGKGDAGIAAKNRGQSWDQGCNWTLGGLLQIHELEVIATDGFRYPRFEIVKEP